jgi:hypothetical protein
MTINSRDYERAEEMRAARRRELDLCRCAWPAVKLRNGSGHGPHCPAHLDFVARRDQGGLTAEQAGQYDGPVPPGAILQPPS